MKRGRPRKYCKECHRSAFYPLDTEGYCRSCRRKLGLNQKWVAIYKNKPKKELRSALYASTIPKGIQPKDMSPEDMYKKEWKSSKLSKILKKYDDKNSRKNYFLSFYLPKSTKKMKRGRPNVNLADIYLNKINPDGTPIQKVVNEWRKKTIKKAIKKDKKKMHCATKEMTVYERLDLLEKMLRCIPKLRKEVADLRKQVYGK